MRPGRQSTKRVSRDTSGLGHSRVEGRWETGFGGITEGNAWEKNMETVNFSTAARPRAEIDPPRQEELT